KIVIIRHEKSKGVAAARNAAVLASSGEYIAFLDADDRWLPDKLSRVVPILESDPDCVLVFHDGLEVDECDRVVAEGFLCAGIAAGPSLDDLLRTRWYGAILPSAVVMRRSAFDRAAGFSEQLTSCEDAYLWVLAREQGTFRCVPEPLMRRRLSYTVDREQWYLEGACKLEALLRARFGNRARPTVVSELLSWAGRNAMGRDDLATARRNFFESIKSDPAKAKNYLRLAWSLIPRKLSRELEALLPTRVARTLGGRRDVIAGYSASITHTQLVNGKID
ncbi:MAG TPA: glycosyltransferase, partial [Candidatus Binataceae bacterium]